MSTKWLIQDLNNKEPHLELVYRRRPVYVGFHIHRLTFGYSITLGYINFDIFWIAHDEEFV